MGKATTKKGRENPDKLGRNGVKKGHEKVTTVDYFEVLRSICLQQGVTCSFGLIGKYAEERNEQELLPPNASSIGRHQKLIPSYTKSKTPAYWQKIRQ